MTVYTIESTRSYEISGYTYVTLTSRNNSTGERKDITVKYFDYCFVESELAKKLSKAYDLKVQDGYKFYMDDVPCSKVYFDSTKKMKSIINSEKIKRVNLFYVKPDFKFLLDKGIKYKFVVNTEEEPVDHNKIIAINTEDIDDPVIIYADIEVDSEGDMRFPSGDNAIHPVISISYVCPGDDLIVSVLDKDIEKERISEKIKIKHELKEFNGLELEIIYFKNEEDLLRHFGELQKQYDSYIVKGWNFIRFDMYYLIGRCKVLKIKPEILSIDNYIGCRKFFDSEGEEKVSVWSSKSYFADQMAEFIDYYYEKQKYNDLNSISKKILGEKFSKFNMGMSIREAYKKDKKRLATYNIIDSILVKMIDEKLSISRFYELKRKKRGLSYSDVSSRIKPINASLMFFAEKKKVALPDIKYEDTKKFLKGAEVYTESLNIFEYAAMLDFKSEYPSIAASLNASRKTLVRDEKLKDNLNKAYMIYKKSGYKIKPKILENYAVSPGKGELIFFDKRIDSFEKKFLMENFKERDYYFEKKNKYEFETLEYQTYDAYEVDVKVDSNSIYGGWKNKYFILSDIDCAQATTGVGRKSLRRIRKIVKNINKKVALSDTDSADVAIEDENITPEEAVKIGYEIEKLVVKEINEYVQKRFLFGSKNGHVEGFDSEENNNDTHWMFAKFEKLFSPIITTGLKKNYAYKLIWKDGRFLPKPKYEIKGFKCIKRDASELLKESQEGTIKKICDKRREFKPEFVDYLKSFKEKIKKNGYDYLATTGKYKTRISEYKAVNKGYLPPINAQAMCNSMENFGISFEPLSNFKVLRVKRKKSGRYEKKETVIDGMKVKFKNTVVAYNDISELPDDFSEYFVPDYKHEYFDIVIHNVAIFLKMFDIDPIVFTGQKQLTQYTKK